MPTPGNPTPFPLRFRRWAASIRRRLLARCVLTGIAIGLVVAGGAAALLWWARLGELRPWAALVGAVGGLVALAVGLRGRWSDQHVALFLDARLQGKETISTAVELGTPVELSDREPDSVRALVLDRAATLLGESDRAKARPRVLLRRHLLALLGAGAVVWLSWLPLPAAPPAPPPAPGTELVQSAHLEGLEKIVALHRLEAQDPNQKKRLDAISAQAEALRAQLARGMEKREAQARIAKLRDEIAAERMRFDNSENRAGLAAAIRKLQSDPRLKQAAEALGNGDLTQFDSKMQKLANQAEQDARDAAKDALKEAAKAARDRGAQELAELLEREREQFERQEAQSDALRELARQLEGHLSEEARRDLEEFGQSGDPEAQRRLAEALDEALGDLSEEERQRLADNLKKELDDANIDPLTKEQLEELSKNLDNPGGREQLKQMLKDLANRDPGADAKRQQGLDDAEKGGADAQKQLGLVPVPQPGASPGSGSNGDKSDQGDQQGGPSEGGGEGEHDGKTDRVESDPLRAKAKTKLDPSVPLRSSTLGRAPGAAGDIANQKGTGALGEVGDAEMDAVERSEVPEEYREQVGRYFQP